MALLRRDWLKVTTLTLLARPTRQARPRKPPLHRQRESAHRECGIFPLQSTRTIKAGPHRGGTHRGEREKRLQQCRRHQPRTASGNHWFKKEFKIEFKIDKTHSSIRPLRTDPPALSRDPSPHLTHVLHLSRELLLLLLLLLCRDCPSQAAPGSKFKTSKIKKVRETEPLLTPPRGAEVAATPQPRACEEGHVHKSESGDAS